MSATAGQHLRASCLRLQFFATTGGVNVAAAMP
jgi:hypothetical protein